MASLVKRGGKWSVQFIDPRGKRKTLALGTTRENQATKFKIHLESLLWSLKHNSTLETATATWLVDIPDAMRQKLEGLGLIEPDADREKTLGTFLDEFFARHDKGKKPRTKTSWTLARFNLEKYFTREKLLSSFTIADADDFELYLKHKARRLRSKETTEDQEQDKTLGSATVRKRVGIVKMFFRDAVRRNLITSNPFADLKSATGSNRERDFFVTTDMATKILNAAPDAEWRAIIALARYGGLRTPSETFALRWEDINWAQNRLTVRCVKTEGHEGKETRLTPIFPELRPYLEDLRAMTPRDAEFVITRYRDESQNLRTQFEKIIKRAGLESWPKLFVNLRATRATELAEQFPGHVAAAWLGHSEKIAVKHYRQVTEDHFERAAKECSALQICARTELHGATTGADLPRIAALNCTELHTATGNIVPSGLVEISQSALATSLTAEERTQRCNSVGPGGTSEVEIPCEPDLQQVVQAWGRLPPAARLQILGIIAQNTSQD